MDHRFRAGRVRSWTLLGGAAGKHGWKIHHLLRWFSDLNAQVQWIPQLGPGMFDHRTATVFECHIVATLSVIQQKYNLVKPLFLFEGLVFFVLLK